MEISAAQTRGSHRSERVHVNKFAGAGMTEPGWKASTHYYPSKGTWTVLIQCIELNHSLCVCERAIGGRLVLPGAAEVSVGRIMGQ